MATEAIGGEGPNGSPRGVTKKTWFYFQRTAEIGSAGCDKGDFTVSELIYKEGLWGVPKVNGKIT